MMKLIMVKLRVTSLSSPNGKNAIWGVLAVLLAVLVLIPSASANQDMIGGMMFDMPNVVGLAVGMAPDYEGSDDTKGAIAPAFNYQFDNRYIRLAGPYLSGNIINSEVWPFGPAPFYRGGRDDDVDDRAVKHMAEIDDAFELGAFVGFMIRDPKNPRIRYGMNLDFLTDVSDEHDGFTIQLSGRAWYPASEMFDVGIVGGVTYADDDYMCTYFSVTPQNVGTSGLALFEADGGIKDVYIQPMVMAHFSKSWHMAAGVRIKSLLSDAKDSPVVDDRGDSTQVTAGLAVAYSW